VVTYKFIHASIVSHLLSLLAALSLSRRRLAPSPPRASSKPPADRPLLASARPPLASFVHLRAARALSAHLGVIAGQYPAMRERSRLRRAVTRPNVRRVRRPIVVVAGPDRRRVGRGRRGGVRAREQRAVREGADVSGAPGEHDARARASAGEEGGREGGEGERRRRRRREAIGFLESASR